MVPLPLCRPPSSFSQMVCKFAPQCCCNNLTVPDFSPSRWGALFIQLEKSSHQNVHSSLYPNHLANSTKPPLKTTSDHLASAPSPSPASAAPAPYKPRERVSFIHSLPSGGQRLIHSVHHSEIFQNRTIWEYRQERKEIKMNSVCFAAPISNTMNKQSSR